MKETFKSLACYKSLVKKKYKFIQDPKTLLKKSEISLILDDYDDIFSDFDPRPYSHRALSDDFLLEARRASYDKVIEYLELKFLLPAKERKLPLEKIIRKRLRDHFIHHYNIQLHEKFKILRKGFMFTFTGIIIMLVTTFILFKFQGSTLTLSFLIVLLEPAGWFSFWEGLNILFFETKNIYPELDFYQKMSKSRISFWTY